MIKNTTTAQGYISPACKTVTLSAKRSYLQTGSPYGALGSAGRDVDVDEDEDY